MTGRLRIPTGTANIFYMLTNTVTTAVIGM